MGSIEPKKLALLRIWQILKYHTDQDNPLTHKQIADHLEKDYNIFIERKAIARNISLLKEADFGIASVKKGTFVEARDFEDSELHLLIDGILCSRHITAKHSKDLIERICGLSNKFFRLSVKNIWSVNEWNKTENPEIFYNIELIDQAIEKKKQIEYDYHKFGIDRKLHKSSRQCVSPYQMILHNQRYYLMAYSEYWQNMSFHRLDHIRNMKIVDETVTNIRKVEGYEKGIDYKNLSRGLPYMYTDRHEVIEFVSQNVIIDQIIDWFGNEVDISVFEDDPEKVQVRINASPKAMEHWAMQYIDHVEIIKPDHLRDRIIKSLQDALEKYAKGTSR